MFLLSSTLRVHPGAPIFRVHLQGTFTSPPFQAIAGLGTANTSSWKKGLKAFGPFGTCRVFLKFPVKNGEVSKVVFWRDLDWILLIHPKKHIETEWFTYCKMQHLAYSNEYSTSPDTGWGPYNLPACLSSRTRDCWVLNEWDADLVECDFDWFCLLKTCTSFLEQVQETMDARVGGIRFNIQNHTTTPCKLKPLNLSPFNK